jgi:CRISPR-associated protein Cas1
VARRIVQAKLKNSRVILQRQARRQSSPTINLAVQSLNHLMEKVIQAESWERLMGLEGAAAAQYFSAFGECLTTSKFVFTVRSRRPPGNPVNAMLSFGYQVLWNHLLSLIELQGLDPYFGCLHQGTRKKYHLAGLFVVTPYSLGKLIEWKPHDNEMGKGELKTPYSLGKLIEWKLAYAL